MPRFKVDQGPLQHNGKTFQAGQSVEMDAKSAEPLIAVGVLASARGAPAQRDPTPGATPSASLTGTDDDLQP